MMVGFAQVVSLNQRENGILKRTSQCVLEFVHFAAWVPHMASTGDLACISFAVEER
jgi:hypothetical protein